MQTTFHLWVNGGELCCKENDEDDKHLATHQEPGKHIGDGKHNDDGNDDEDHDEDDGNDDEDNDGNDNDNDDTDDNLSTLSLRFAICPSL